MYFTALGLQKPGATFGGLGHELRALCVIADPGASFENPARRLKAQGFV